jgi:CheY-like chemotaxis protein/HPt (histidine-containing phosphotransfer) domain-containing protein
VADDNAVNRKLVARLLSKRGHTIEEAEDGVRALEAIEQAQPRGFDVVLMDVQMPEMGGFEATAAVRQREAATGVHLPIIAMTAHAMEGDRDRCLRAGMDSYLPKPIDADLLIATIEGAATSAVTDAAPPAPARETILNEAQVLTRVGGDRDLLAEMAALFREDCPKTLGALRQAVKAGDAHKVQTIAHALKGAVATFGAEAAFDAARDLETMGRRCDLGGAEAGLALLEREIPRLEAALAALTPAPRAAKSAARKRKSRSVKRKTRKKSSA